MPDEQNNFYPKMQQFSQQSLKPSEQYYTGSGRKKNNRSKTKNGLSRHKGAQLNLSQQNQAAHNETVDQEYNGSKCIEDDLDESFGEQDYSNGYGDEGDDMDYNQFPNKRQKLDIKNEQIIPRN